MIARAFFIAVLLLILIIGGAEYLTWNYVVVNLPIKGIKIEHLSFVLACKLSFALLAIQVIGMFGIQIVKGFFED
jgi:hypothetical protein